jgi:hypothetical protein
MPCYGKNMGEETVTIPKSEYEVLKILKPLVEQPAKRVKGLEEEIRLLKNDRSSKTSSTPPSQDMGRSNHTSLREKSGKPSGGQRGHEGNTLNMRLLCKNLTTDLTDDTDKSGEFRAKVRVFRVVCG